VLQRVILESPYAGDVLQNERYARLCMHDCLQRGVAPFASHLLYTQPFVLDDTDPVQRRLGMEAGFSWGEVADYVVVYDDLGVSPGMKEGIKRARDRGLDILYRSLGI